ncbi:hypothetical protein, partial [Acinetobacter baumannii]|uniref:hypothetical protein n=1 Tax=Acinetobacter baumannii TaxID=470 RepID=UPI001131AB2B
LPAMQNDISMSGFTRGESDQKPLLIKGHALAAAICYEVAYPNLTRRNAEDSGIYSPKGTRRCFL